MATQFQIIGIMGKVKNTEVRETLINLINYLRELKQEILVDSETADALNDPDLSSVSRDELSKRCHLIIVVGGDGSLLHAAHTAVNEGIPVLGVNRGRLGFLTDIHPTEFEKIKDILNGHYILEKRFLLTATVEHQGHIIGVSDALNEVALIPDFVPHMNEFEIYIDDQFVCSQNSDGVIIATPTGSTAYALSGGGPILYPQLDAMVIVPMFPHSLSIRPIVIEGNRRIKLIISGKNNVTPRVTCDGQIFINTPPGSTITISKKPEHLHLIHPVDYDYYETLRSKLHWGHKLHYSK